MATAPSATAEGKREIARRLKPFRRVLLETPADDALDFGWNRCVGPLHRWWIGVEQRTDGVSAGLTVKGAATRQHFVEHRTEREDVGAVVDRLAAHLLGRHVADRPKHGSGRRLRHRHGDGQRAAGIRVRIDVREAEIQNLDPAVSGRDDVLGLEIAMDDAALVGGGDRGGHLARIVDGFPHRQRAVAEPITQRYAVDQLGDQIRCDALEPDVVQREDVRMAQRGNGARLALEAGHRIRVGGKRRRQHFEGDVAAQPRVARSIDLAHTAHANERHDFVRADTRAGGASGHRGRMIQGPAEAGTRRTSICRRRRPTRGS